MMQSCESFSVWPTKSGNPSRIIRRDESRPSKSSRYYFRNSRPVPEGNKRCFSHTCLFVVLIAIFKVGADLGAELRACLVGPRK